VIELNRAGTRVLMRYVHGTGSDVLKDFAPGTRIVHITEGHNDANGRPFLRVWLLVPEAS
jgi:hypothetical protein